MLYHSSYGVWWIQGDFETTEWTTKHNRGSYWDKRVHEYYSWDCHWTPENDRCSSVRLCHAGWVFLSSHRRWVWYEVSKLHSTHCNMLHTTLCFRWTTKAWPKRIADEIEKAEEQHEKDENKFQKNLQNDQGAFEDRLDTLEVCSYTRHSTSSTVSLVLCRW